MKWILIAGGVVAILLIGLHYYGDHLGTVRIEHTALEPGNIEIPRERTLKWLTHSDLTDALLKDWASRELKEWRKNSAHRILLAKFATRHDLDAANAFLKRQVPWGNTGSTWLLHPEGDYDFSLLGLTVILHLFGDAPDVLYPDTRDHLVSVLLTKEGGQVEETVPRTLGFVKDTENHLLMTEGARYLKNRWLMLHGSQDPQHNNDENGLEAWLLGNLMALQSEGLFEFNSVPYIGYTLTALMNLEAFGSPLVQEAARLVLDRANMEYAVGSLSLRRFAPFRRQLHRSGETALNKDHHTALMNVWMSLKDNSAVALAGQNSSSHALWACLLPYRLADKTASWVEEKPVPYFVKVGHGVNASPEIYAGRPGYLITAGGVHRGRQSLIVARPITLMVDDGAQDLDDVIHLSGPGDVYTGWNNTGVHRDFACAAGAVHIPEGWTPVVADDVWSIYRVGNDVHVAVHSRRLLGILCVFREYNAQDILDAIREANPDTKILDHMFQWPGREKLIYDVNAPKDRWVMISVDGVMLDREFDGWPLMDGHLE